MSNTLEYRGYHTKVLYDVDSHILHGKIEGIRDFINFEASNPEDVEKEFREAVDEYLAFCEEVGKSPDKEYRGTFNIRIDPSLHRELALEADKKDVSMNQLVENAIDNYLHPKTVQENTVVLIKGNESRSTAKTPVLIPQYHSNSFVSNPLMGVTYDQ